MGKQNILHARPCDVAPGNYNSFKCGTYIDVQLCA